MAIMPSALNLECSDMLSKGRIGLIRHGKLIWTGKISDPWEDVEFDTILLSRTD